MRSKSRRPQLKARELGMEDNSLGFKNYTELFKKYQKLKRIFKKKARNEKILQEKVDYLLEQNKLYEQKIKKMSRKG